MKDKFTIYFAGSLFNHKDLIGNALLAEYIEEKSSGRYRCSLPQNEEQHQTTALDIRNKDILSLMTCDLGLFCFDGTELDAGVVVEFMIAKFLDIPAVILRTDFRTCGEKEIGGEDWNFMCSFYPRTRVVKINAIQSYQKAINENGDLNQAIDGYYNSIAESVVENLDSVRREAPLLAGNRSKLEFLYQWALKFPGGGLDRAISEASFENEFLNSKIKRRLL